MVARVRPNRRHSALRARHAELSADALNRDVTDATGRLCLAALSGDHHTLGKLAALTDSDPLAAAVVALCEALAVTVSRPESVLLDMITPQFTDRRVPYVGYRSRRRRRADRVANRCLFAVVLACAPPPVSLVPTQATPRLVKDPTRSLNDEVAPLCEGQPDYSKKLDGEGSGVAREG